METKGTLDTDSVEYFENFVTPSVQIVPTNYVKDAVRTESQIPAVQVNVEDLKSIIKAFIAAGNMLDLIKKQVFYNKDIDATKWNNNLLQLQNVAEKQILPYKDAITQPITSLDLNPRLFHVILGIATESTELMEALIGNLDNNKELDHVNIREEIFDVLWYVLVGHDAMNMDFDGTLKMGFEKLKRRYPEKFTNEHAINRDVDAEREILESHN